MLVLSLHWLGWEMIHDGGDSDGDGDDTDDLLFIIDGVTRMNVWKNIGALLLSSLFSLPLPFFHSSAHRDPSMNGSTVEPPMRMNVTCIHSVSSLQEKKRGEACPPRCPRSQSKTVQNHKSKMLNKNPSRLLSAAPWQLCRVSETSRKSWHATLNPPERSRSLINPHSHSHSHSSFGRPSQDPG